MNEEHDEDCVEERFQLARVKFDIDGKWGREALGMRYCAINICDGSELKLAWSRKNSSSFEENRPTILLSGNSNTAYFNPNLGGLFSDLF